MLLESALSHHAVTAHRHLVPEGPFDLASASTKPHEARPKDHWQAQLAEHVSVIADLQGVLYAHDVHALLLVFQGMDASGKDGTIRKVLSGVNPAGCHVVSFKAPSPEELDHDYLWRVSAHLPPRGVIGAFNRSHYEDLVTVRVYPERLGSVRLRSRAMLDDIWQRRFRAVRDWERHLADNGTVLLKFFLHIDREEQRKRLLERLDEPDKRWKFDLRDLDARARWDDHQAAYSEAITATHRTWAPWYVIPANDKAYARAQVAELVRRTLERMDLRYPAPDPELQRQLDVARESLRNER